jgi:hypothetical protein
MNVQRQGISTQHLSIDDEIQAFNDVVRDVSSGQLRYVTLTEDAFLETRLNP